MKLLKQILFWIVFFPMSILLIILSLISSGADCIIEWMHQFEGWAFNLHKYGFHHIGSGIWTDQKD